MEYEITRIKDHEAVAIEPTVGVSFATIQGDAKNWVDQGLADRVEVRDAKGNLVYHYPRVMRAVAGGS